MATSSLAGRRSPEATSGTDALPLSRRLGIRVDLAPLLAEITTLCAGPVLQGQGGCVGAGGAAFPRGDELRGRFPWWPDLRAADQHLGVQSSGPRRTVAMLWLRAVQHPYVETWCCLQLSGAVLGRTSCCRHCGESALSSAMNIVLYHRWIPSERNSADGACVKAPCEGPVIFSDCPAEPRVSQ